MRNVKIYSSKKPWFRILKSMKRSWGCRMRWWLCQFHAGPFPVSPPLGQFTGNFFQLGNCAASYTGVFRGARTSSLNTSSPKTVCVGDYNAVVMMFPGVGNCWRRKERREMYLAIKCRVYEFPPSFRAKRRRLFPICQNWPAILFPSQWLFPC